jgi:hypothetical protein
MDSPRIGKNKNPKEEARERVLPVSNGSARTSLNQPSALWTLVQKAAGPTGWGYVNKVLSLQGETYDLKELLASKIERSTSFSKWTTDLIHP